MALEMTRRSAIAATAAAAVAAAATPALAEDEMQAAGGFVTGEALVSKQDYFGYTSEAPSFMTAPEPVAADQIVATLDCDVLVIGAGLAGTSAARAAAEGGAKVICVEKMHQPSCRGAGAGTINSKLSCSFEDGTVKDIPAAEFRWMQTCGNRLNEALVAKYMYRSGEAADWLCEAGEKHKCFMGIWDGYSRHELLPDEPGYVCMSATDDSDINQPYASFVAADVQSIEAMAAGAEFMFECPAQYLLQDESGAVTGAIVLDEEGYKQINAPKVIMATGDIGGSEEMMRYYCPEGISIPSVYTPAGANTGDGHKMILWAGGHMGRAPFATALHPQRWADPFSNQLEGPFLYVNEKGERFFNEGTWVQARSLQIMQNTADDCAWSIFDSSWPEDLMASFPYGGGMFWDMFRYKGESDYQTTIDYYTQSLIDADGSTYETADTLEELAEKIGVPADKLVETVNHYNEICASGVDTDFCKRPELLFPCDTPPFHASKVGAVLLVVCGGAVIDANFQCLDVDGNPIPGLYAVGNTSGGTAEVDYPINVPGNSHGQALTQGYLAGRICAGVE